MVLFPRLEAADAEEGNGEQFKAPDSKGSLSPPFLALKWDRTLASKTCNMMRSCQLPACQRITVVFGTWIIQKRNYPLIQPTDLHIRSFLVPFRMCQAQAAAHSPDMQSSPAYPAVIIKWLVLMHPLGSFVVHFKLAFLLICLISVNLWDISTTNNGWTRCVCVLHKGEPHKGNSF